MIHNIGVHNILNPQIQNLGLKKIVSQINATVSQNQNLDTVILSKKAKVLLAENSEAKAKEKEPIINYDDSDMVSSIRWGSYTKAEFAQMSLSLQRDDLKSLSNQIDYAKSKLEFTMNKISELENYINGTSSHSDPNLSILDAKAYLQNYKQSIIDDYANLRIERNQYNADDLDNLSGRLASQAFTNPLHSLNAKSLGLSELSNDPKEIMKALDNASNILEGLSISLENAYSSATGGKTFKEAPRTIFAYEKNPSFSFFASQMEKNYNIETISLKDFKANGQTLSINQSITNYFP